jgi:hypothetical protein
MTPSLAANGGNHAAQWADLADTLGQTALDILAGAPVTVTEKGFAEPKILAIMLMSRTLSNFRGVFTLIENGLVVEARILARCCFENAFWIAGLRAQGDKFVNRMLQDEMRSRRSRGELALSKKAEILEHTEKRLRNQLRAINKKWPNAKSLNPKEVAFSGLLSHGYLIYSQLSADAAHPTLTSLHRHRGAYNSEGEAVIEVVPPLKDDEVTMTWDWACNAMIGACVGVNEILGGTLAGHKLGQIADSYQSLVNLRLARSQGASG